ncbi:hypothetical protein BGX34_000071 [Mortierella sp. NVP85]|nr:hypothetical protein BGX34_000071 [Mortierella sp. NVP85]
MGDDVLESTHCKTLEVLEWMRDPAFIDEVLHRRPRRDGLHRFLVSCSTLKVFNGIERYVKADDMIREPWAYLGIEKLRFRIVGVERLTQDEQTIYDRVVAENPRYQDEGIVPELGDEERAVIQKFERGREQQQRVYERLGNLRLLKHLDLGFESRNPRQWRYGYKYVSKIDGESYQRYGGPIPDTLELSLESGLDQLGALKDLELFGFEAIDHRIGKKELEWMAKSLPKLRLMYGLAEDRLPMIEPDRKKAELRKYMEGLRLDVKHHSLYVDPDLR